MSLPSEFDAALALLEMANERGHLEQETTDNHCEEETVNLGVRTSTSSSERSWADIMEESDSELSYIWPSWATEPAVPKRVLPVMHRHPSSSPSPLSKEWTVSPQLDAAETFDTSMQTNRRSWGDVQYTDDDSLFLDPSHTDRLEDHEITKTVATLERHCFDVRKGISLSTTLHQLVLLRCTVRKSKGQGYIPNSHNDEENHENFQKRITEHIRYHLRQPFYIC
jgi:hypothetical protein